VTTTATPYGAFLTGLGQAAFTFASDTFKVCLLTSSYSPNQDTHTYYSDLNNEVAAGGGYTTGGQALTGVTWTYDATNKRTVLGANNLTWPAANFTMRYAVVYKSTGTGTTSRLIGYVDYGGSFVLNQDFVITFSTGVMRIKAG
jgi:hypothetical protein